MGTTNIALLGFACVFGGAALGMLLRAVLPPHHLSADTKDVVKLAMGVVATTSALVLGLLVALVYLPWHAALAFHGFYEFAAKDRFQGQNFGVALSKKF